jgi:hypothetical protein
VTLIAALKVALAGVIVGGLAILFDVGYHSMSDTTKAWTSVVVGANITSGRNRKIYGHHLVFAVELSQRARQHLFIDYFFWSIPLFQLEAVDSPWRVRPTSRPGTPGQLDLLSLIDASSANDQSRSSAFGELIDVLRRVCRAPVSRGCNRPWQCPATHGQYPVFVAEVESQAARFSALPDLPSNAK